MLRKMLPSVVATLLTAVAIYGGLLCYRVHSVHPGKARPSDNSSVVRAKRQYAEASLPTGIRAADPKADSPRADAAPSPAEKLLTESRLARASLVFAPLYQKLLADHSLDAAAVGRLNELLQQRELALADTVDAALKLGVGRNSPEMRNALIATDLQMDQDIEQAVGSTAAAKYRSYRAQSALQPILDEAAASAEGNGVSFDPAERTQIVAAIGPSSIDTTDYGRFTSSDSANAPAVSPDALAKIREVTSPAQFQLLKQAVDHQRSVARLREIFYSDEFAPEQASRPPPAAP